MQIEVGGLLPRTADYRGSAGTAQGHYFHQDLWAARRIYLRRPETHFDVASRIDGFIAHLLVFTPVTVIDILPLKSKISGLNFVRDDATMLNGFADRSTESISSLHAAEHFGLGRYSDPVDPHAHIKFMKSLQRVLARSGHLYFSVPIGRERLRFNGHRIFDPKTVVGIFDELRVSSFAYVDDAGDLVENVAPEDVPPSTRYGCGLFDFTRER
jgi:Caenorhabditis protein of unknown function, DUF268